MANSKIELSERLEDLLENTDKEFFTQLISDWMSTTEMTAFVEFVEDELL